MQITKISQQNQTDFTGYKRVKFVKGKLVAAKKRHPKAVNLFVAGGPSVDKKVADANKKILEPKVKENQPEPNSVCLFFAGILASLGFVKPLNKLLNK